VGEDCLIHAGARIGERCVLGQRVVVQANAVIGSDGFGFVTPEKGSIESAKETGGAIEAQNTAIVRINSIGNVVIGDDVEIGANSSIDRGALDDTVIGDGVKLDNQIQIGHNCRVGAHTAMAGCVAVAGSADIGSHCTIGAGALILGHLSICDHAHVSADTVISRSIRKPGTYTGMFPADDHESWARNTAVVRQLADLVDRVRSLEKRIPKKEQDDG